MGIVNLVLLVAGVALIVLGCGAGARPVAAVPGAASAAGANVARYESLARRHPEQPR